MNAESVTAWATAITAFGALALIGVTLWVEYSRRRNERAQFHIQQLRELVCQPLRNQIIGRYLPILERQDSIIRLDTRELSSKYDPLRGKTIEWTLQLATKSASPSHGWSVGEHQRCIDYDATFPHLYHDTKTKHFPELVGRWEDFVERVDQLGERSLDLCQIWHRKLEEHIGLPARHDLSTPRPWVNYVALSHYLYAQLWCRYPNSAGSFQESGYWALRFHNYNLAEGQQEHLTLCLEAIAMLVRTESVENLLQLAEQLKQEAIELKEELERLVLTQLVVGPCPYVKVPRL